MAMVRKARHCKKKAEKNNNSAAIYCDITVNDFANNESQKRFRQKKKTTMKTIINEVKMLQVKEEDKAWDEKSDDDKCGQNEETIPEQITGKNRRKARKSTSVDGEGINYPLDIWFIISEYLRPEDVGRFATTCQATYYVTTTAKFWFSMYRRHYTWVPELPTQLADWNMDYTEGLRAAVIRSLFFMYAPFSARIAGKKPLRADPTQLLRSQCVLQWHVATSSSVCESVMVIGEYLYHAGLEVSANMYNDRLRLSLVPAHLLPRSSNAASRKYQVPTKEIILEPVCDVKVYPWWHPQYEVCAHTTSRS
nr:transmembrane protein 183-like isoform X2 [Cherax quadricarinatus]